MVINSNSLVRLTKAQVKPVAEIMARAFQDYPLMAYFFPDESARKNKLPHVFQHMIRYGILYGEVYATSQNLEGVAVWLRSEKVHRTLWRNIRSSNWSVLFKGARRNISRERHFGDYAASMQKRHAPFPHLYLQIIGVDPVHQGKGYASVLLRAMFAKIDEERLPCYIMTQIEKNVSIYQHHGFRVMEESTFPGSDVITWAMLRDNQG